MASTLKLQDIYYRRNSSINLPSNNQTQQMTSSSACPPTMTTNTALSNTAKDTPPLAPTVTATSASPSTCASATASAGTGGGQGTKRRCRWDNSTVPGPPIQRSYGTHSHTTFPTLNSILFWPVKAMGNRITIGTYNMSSTPQQIIFISNHEITAHKNSANSYDSNGIKYMRIRGLYEEIRNLPGFCLREWRNT